MSQFQNISKFLCLSGETLVFFLNAQYAVCHSMLLLHLLMEKHVSMAFFKNIETEAQHETMFTNFEPSCIIVGKKTAGEGNSCIRKFTMGLAPFYFRAGLSNYPIFTVRP